MLKIERTHLPVVCVESEPGDATHYSYIATLFGDVLVTFFGFSSFDFPEEIRKTELSMDLDYSYPPNVVALEHARAVATRSGCSINVMTALECLRTAQMLFKEEEEENVNPSH